MVSRLSYSPTEDEYNPEEVNVMGSSGALHTSNPESESDNEYRVEPILSPTTPVYAPSRSIVNKDGDSLLSSPVPEERIVKKRGMSVAEPELGTTATEAPPKKRKISSSIGDEDESEEDEDITAISTEKLQENGPDKADIEFDGFDGDEEGAKGIIADIFGESDAEEEGDFEGFAENEVEKATATSLLPNVISVDIEDNHEHQRVDQEPQTQSASDNEGDDEFVSDFDRLMFRRREENRRRRRLGRDEEFLNDNDEIIRETISKMRIAAEEDRHLLSKNKPATRKLGMLNAVRSLLLKADMKSALIDNGILSAITEWLSPVSGHTLPSISIRETLLKHLAEFRIQEPDLLKESGIGKAVMYLYKHPRETRENKRLAGHLINEWSRPIFNRTSDYGSLTREERKQLDYEHLPKRRHHSKGEANNNETNEKSPEMPIALRPGDPGWVNRARVPQPSNKDYVIRPKWNVPTNPSAFEDGDEDDGFDESKERDAPRSSRRRRTQQSSQPPGATSSSIERHIRTLTKNAAMRRKARFVRAVPMSIEGKNM